MLPRFLSLLSLQPIWHRQIYFLYFLTNRLSLDARYNGNRESSFLGPVVLDKKYGPVRELERTGRLSRTVTKPIVCKKLYEKKGLERTGRLSRTVIKPIVYEKRKRENKTRVEKTITIPNVLM